jgi:glycerate-2-kinase
VYVFGAGKSAYSAAKKLEEILEEKLSGGVVIGTREESPLSRVQYFAGSHPLPAPANREACRRMMQSLDGLRDKDLAIIIVSGGGSVLLADPEGDVQEELAITRSLMHSGANIEELNTVRKHQSFARGGNLARLAHPARVAALLFSDVPGNNFQFISSGPTVMDTTSLADARSVLNKYDILKKCSLTDCRLLETPRENKWFEKVKNYLVVSPEIAVKEMAATAQTHGFVVHSDSMWLRGEARQVGSEIVSALHKAPSNTAYILAGETSVKVVGHGQGGRNLEVALSAVMDIRPGELVLSLASDGEDNGPFAGAIADAVTADAFHRANVSASAALRINDSHTAFESVGGYLLTGPTGCNVADLLIAIKS